MFLSIGKPITNIGIVMSTAMGDNRTDFGCRLFQARKSAKLTQAEAAKAVGIKQSTLSELENDGMGSAYTPALASLYGVSAIWLATGEGERTAGVPERSKSPLSAEEKAMDEYRRQLLLFFDGMSLESKDLLLSMANKLYSSDNPDDKGAMPFPLPSSSPELREETWVAGVSPDRRKNPV
jgi:transcriptional regulator with XRE-family HTH domain